jgi:signal transduction histidine kinase
VSDIATAAPLPVAILDTLDLAILAVAADWRITYANEVWASRRGRPLDTLVGWSLWEAFPRLRGAPEVAVLEATMADGIARDYRVPFADQTVDGIWDVMCTREPGGQLIITSRDVTQQARLERVHDRLLDSIGEGLFVCNADWRVEYWNAAAERITRRRRGTVIGQHLWSAFPGLAGTSFERLYRQTMLERVAATGHAIEYRPASTRTPGWHAPAGVYDARAYPVEGGGLLVIFAEVSERERQAQLLRSLFEEARAANEAKTAILATLSHELRTPLAAIAGYGELLEDEIEGPLTPAQRDTMGRLRAVTQHLTVLIEEMLTFAALEARVPGAPIALQVSTVDLGEVLQQLRDLVGPLARGRGLECTLSLLPDAPPIETDVGKLQQILLNLTSNAIKYTPPGGAVHVRIRGDVGGGARIEVSDTGIGIDERDRARLFRPFGQLDGPLRRSEGGAGLGLYICRQLVDALGGAITYQSTVGVGTTFEVTVPPYPPSRAGAGTGTTVPM